MNEILAIERPAPADRRARLSEARCPETQGPEEQAVGHPVEIEIKLAASAAMMAALRHHPLLGEACARDLMATTYFDTSDKALADAGASLRLRRSAKGCEQTLKMPLKRKSQIQRCEWNHPLPGGADAPDPAAFPSHAADVLAKLTGTKLAARAKLVPYAEVAVERETRVVYFGASWIEVAFDLGRISPVGPDSRDQAPLDVAEIELELREGRIADLLALALELPLGPELQWSLATKAQRARSIGLRTGGPVQAVPAKALALTPDMTAARAVQAIGWACVTQLLANSAQVIAHGDPEAIHQTRVAIRRLRAGLALFAQRLFAQDGMAKLLRAELREAASAMAPARDLHVLRQRLLGADAPDKALLALLEQAEAKATTQARKALADEPFQRLLLRIAHWLEAGDWLAAPRAGHALPPLAAALLTRQRARIKGAKRRLAGMSDGALHDLRIEVKKLRYATDFFTALAPDPRAATAHEEALGRLQATLGEIQDLAQAQATLAHAFSLSLDEPPEAEVQKLSEAMASSLTAHARPRAKLIERARSQLKREKASAGWWQTLAP